MRLRSLFFLWDHLLISAELSRSLRALQVNFTTPWKITSRCWSYLAMRCARTKCNVPTTQSFSCVYSYRYLLECMSNISHCETPRKTKELSLFINKVFPNVSRTDKRQPVRLKLRGRIPRFSLSLSLILLFLICIALVKCFPH